MRNKYKQTLASIVSVALIMMSLASTISAAQQPTGSIEGLVTDPQGAVVPSASITAREVTTNLTRSVKAGEDGRYRIGQLPPGNYELKVSGPGFKSSVIPSVKVDVGTNASVDVKLEIGGASETVTVTGGGEAQVDRTDHTVSGVVGRVQIQNMPLNGRNFLDLANLAGAQTVDGASFDPTKANYTGVSIAGQAGRSTQITVDGGSVVDNVVGTTVQNFSQEIVQEFQVGLTNFDLSTGASASGSVNVVTRSGSNEFHGNGYSYWRDDRWSAFPSLNRLDAIHGVPPEAQKDRIPFDRQQFGGTISGPIKKDKLFFFGNAEYNNQDAVALHVLSPTIKGFNGFSGNPFNNLLVTAKVDWNFSDKMTVFGRYSHDGNDQQAPFPLGSGIVPKDSKSGIFQSEDQLDTNRSDGFVIGVTRSFRADLTNDFRYNYNNFHNRIDPVTKDFPSIRVINPDQNWRSGTNYITPQVTNQIRNQVKDDLSWTRHTHTFRFGGDWERTTIDGLFDFAKPARIRIFGPGFGSPIPELVTEDDFLNSPVRDLSLGVGSGVLPFNTKGKTLNHRFQFYGTDSWKITHNFTFNYGLAYRIDSNLWNHDQGHPAVIAPLFGKGTSASPKDTNNWAPRVGFAWDLKGNGRTVIRGGFGIYYDTAIDNLRLFERADLGPPGSELFLVGTDIQSALLPGGDGRFSNGNPSTSSGFITLRDMLALFPAVRKDVESRAFNCTLPTSVECFQSVSGPLFSTEFQIPYSLQYAIGIQKELPGKMLVQADFNYRKGVHEVLVYDANFFQRVDKNGNSIPLTSFPNGVSYADSSAFSTYKGLLVRVNRRFSDGVQFTASYTLSRFKAFGNDTLGLGATVTDFGDFRKEFGPAGNDQTHRFGMSFLWELPYFKDNPSALKKQVLGGWTVAVLSAIASGRPLQAFLPDFVNLSGSTQDISSYLPGTQEGSLGRDVNSLSKLNELIRNYNANRSSLAARIEDGLPVDPYGTPLRELAELPPGTPIGTDSSISTDLRLTKGFRFTESMKLELIGEVFNIFNVANLSIYDDQILPAKEDTLDPGFEFTTFRPSQRRTSVFGSGGPRSFQFAVRFTF
ncbi:MAG TPA: carboxypeptidase regulatory-like domain-containing protein [Blastocatellia bacterium]|nr:carboxypeptidase regulatory-like domain-containing protein [Blastocatellia bacterium]